MKSIPKQLIAAGLADRKRCTAMRSGDSCSGYRTIAVDLSKLGMQALLDPSVKKISIANPQHAPYGRAAKRHCGTTEFTIRSQAGWCWEKTFRRRRSLSNRATRRPGLIALSHALTPAMKAKGRYWTVPLDSYPTLNQAAVVLSRSKQQEAARKFLEFLRSPGRQFPAPDYGFSLPEEKH